MARPSARRPRAEREGRTATLRLRCTPGERAEIEAAAAAAGLGLSEYMRVTALHGSAPAKVDRATVAALAAHAGNLSRLGGLLKLWLSERRGDGAPAVAVDQVLAEIRTAVDRLADAATALVAGRR